jgi:HSP20 family protein
MDRTRQLPGRQAEHAREDMDRLFRSLVSQQRRLHAQVVGGWRPHLEVYETGEALVVRAELAGVDEGTLDVVVQDRVLLIRGVRLRDRGDGRRVFHQMEISYGPFAAEVAIPFAIEPERVEATHAGGILEVLLPKTPPRRIVPRGGRAAADRIDDLGTDQERV